MSAWLIFALFLGPLALFGAWAVFAQLRGRFEQPEPVRSRPDFFQRHATLFILILAAGLSYYKAGVVGVIVAATVVILLSVVAALIVTAIEGRKTRSVREQAAPDAEAGGEPPASFFRRFLRNFRRAIPELMGYVS